MVNAARSGRSGAHRLGRSPLPRVVAVAGVVALVWSVAAPVRAGASPSLARGDDDTIELHATGDGSSGSYRADGGSDGADGSDRSDGAEGGRVGGVRREGADEAADGPDLVPGVLRVLSQRFSYGGFDAAAVSVRVLGPPAASSSSTGTSPTPGTTVPPGRSTVELATRSRTVSPIVARSASRSAQPVVVVELRVRNTTPTHGRLEDVRMRAGRSVYVATELRHGQVDGSGTSTLRASFRIPRAATSLLDSAMLVVGAPRTSQAVVPLGRRPAEPAVRHPRAEERTVRSTPFAAPGGALGTFEVTRLEHGASVARLEAPDVGMRWLGIEYGLCTLGAPTSIRPVLVVPGGEAGPMVVQPVGNEVRAGSARGPLPVAPTCPGWSTAVAHWQVPVRVRGAVVVQLIAASTAAGYGPSEIPGGGAAPEVVGSMQFEVPELPAESTPPTARPCPP